MPKLETIHDAVKNALTKDGWTITSDLHKIRYEENTVYADIAAERPIAAERGGEKLIMEVFEERRSLLPDLREDVLEDIALTYAIEEGEKEEFTCREEVFKLFEGEI